MTPEGCEQISRGYRPPCAPSDHTGTATDSCQRTAALAHTPHHKAAVVLLRLKKVVDSASCDDQRKGWARGVLLLLEDLKSPKAVTTA